MPRLYGLVIALAKFAHLLGNKQKNPSVERQVEGLSGGYLVSRYEKSMIDSIGNQLHTLLGSDGGIPTGIIKPTAWSNKNRIECLDSGFKILKALLNESI